MSDVYTRQRSMLEKLAYTFFSTPEDQEDALQELYIRMLNTDWEKVDNEQAFAYTLTANFFRDLLRKKSAIKRVESMVDASETIDYDDPLTVLEREFEEEHLNSCIELLPTDLRAVAEMYYYDGLSYKLIADEFGIPEGTVASRLNTARKYLRGEPT